MLFSTDMKFNKFLSMFLLAACLSILFVHTANAGTVTFGIKLALNESTAGSTYAQQVQTLQGLEIWRDWFNSLPIAKRTTQWGEVIDVALHIETRNEVKLDFTADALTELCAIYGNMSINSSIDYLFTPIAVLGVAVRRCAYDQHGVGIMVGSTDSSEGYYAIPGSFGSTTANVLTLTSWLSYLRVAKTKTIAILRINDYVYQSEMCQGVADEAAVNGITTLLYQDIPFDWYTLGAPIDGIPSQKQAWSEALENIIKLNPDAVVVCDYGAGAKFSLEYIRKRNWNPKSFAVSATPQFDDPSLFDFVVIPSQFSPSSKFAPQADFTDSAGYNALVFSRYGVSATSVMAQATVAGMMYTDALLNSKSNNTFDMVNTMRQNQMKTFMGLSVMDGHDRNTRPSLITQRLNSGRQVLVVGPVTAAVDEFIYPMPTWSERIFRNKWGSKVEIAAVVLIALGCINSIFWAVFMIVYRENKVIIGASPVFCSLVIFANTVISLSIITWMPNLVSTIACMLRPWFLPLGFIILFASILVKTHRINRIFNDKALMRELIITNWSLAPIIGLIVVGQICISIFMVSIPPQIRSEMVIVDPYRLSKNYYRCTFHTHVKALVGIDAAYALGLLAWGTYLAYKVRKAPSAMWDESRIIAFSIYNTAVCAAVATIVQIAIGNDNRDLTFMVTAVCSFLGGNITTICLFATKWYIIRSTVRKSSKSESTNKSGGKSNGTSMVSIASPGGTSPPSNWKERDHDFSKNHSREKSSVLKYDGVAEEDSSLFQLQALIKEKRTELSKLKLEEKRMLKEQVVAPPPSSPSSHPEV